MIKWNGTYSTQYNVIVEAIPRRTISQKKINVYPVPGRTGDIIDDEQAFENYSQQYQIFIEGDEINNLPLRARAIANWLMEPNGYAVLEDDYDIGSFRYAYFKGPLDIETWFNIHGQATIEFICDPHRYLSTGQTAISMLPNLTYTLNNPTSFIARPLIKVYNNSMTESINATVTISGKTLNILGIGAGESITIDCETGQAYFGNTSKNMNISCVDFPYLNKGNNLVTITGADRVEITPRWWIL